MRMKFTLFLLVVALSSATFFSFKTAQTPEPHYMPFGDTDGWSKPKQDSITIIGVGDIMMGTNYPSTNFLPPFDGKQLFEFAAPELKKATLAFGNLEGVLLDAGGSVKHCSDPSKCYAFRMPERYVNHLVEAGFDVMSIANNHMGDFGEFGRHQTTEVLEEAGIQHAGLLTKPTAIWEKDGVKYGLCAFAPNTGTCDIRDMVRAESMVQKLAQECDIVIVSFHGGAEGSNHQHVTRKTETFYGENRGNVYSFAHSMIDAGADLVFGHGPHVARAVEVYKDRFITYSMGNFCTYARFNLDGPNALAPAIKVWIDSKGHFYKGQIIPFVQVGEGGPYPDEQKKCIQKIKELTEADFPEAVIKVQNDGWILRKESSN